MNGIFSGTAASGSRRTTSNRGRDHFVDNVSSVRLLAPVANLISPANGQYRHIPLTGAAVRNGTMGIDSALIDGFVLLGVFRGHFSQATNGRSDGNGRRCRQRISATSDYFTARFAFPNTHIGSLDIVLAAKDATIGTVLGDFNLAYELAQCTTVTGTVLSSDSDLLCALTHIVLP
jgi:hypothetical protein